MNANCKQLWTLAQLLLVLLSTIVLAAPFTEENRLEELEDLFDEAYPEDEDNIRNAVKNPVKLWPTTTLRYRIADDYTANEASNVRTALSYFNEHTCLNFEEHTDLVDTDQRFIFFKKSEKMCGTNVGFNQRTPTGAHNVLLNPFCLTKPGVVQHETLHVLGLYHEQSRPDRDDYVSIDFTNIPLRYWTQFAAQSNYQVTTYDVPYDYGSIMHYPKNAFARDPSKPTMRAKDGNTIVDRDMGQHEAPSEGDLIKIRRMYKCEAR